MAGAFLSLRRMAERSSAAAVGTAVAVAVASGWNVERLERASEASWSVSTVQVG